jgi:hypothetical protein
MVCEENEAEVECDKTGEPCYLRAVQLLPDNLLAWELYHQSRLEGVGAFILELRSLSLSAYEAEVLAYKLDVIGSTYCQLQADETKRIRDETEMRRRRGGS